MQKEFQSNALYDISRLEVLERGEGKSPGPNIKSGVPAQFVIARHFFIHQSIRMNDKFQLLRYIIYITHYSDLE